MIHVRLLLHSFLLVVAARQCHHQFSQACAIGWPMGWIALIKRSVAAGIISSLQAQLVLVTNSRGEKQASAMSCTRHMQFNVVLCCSHRMRSAICHFCKSNCYHMYAPAPRSFLTWTSVHYDWGMHLCSLCPARRISAHTGRCINVGRHQSVPLSGAATWCSGRPSTILRSIPHGTSVAVADALLHGKAVLLMSSAADHWL